MKTILQSSPKIYIIIVNYDGWKDSINCLESVFELTGVDYDVVVCDNHSCDHSLERILSFVKSKFPDAALTKEWFSNNKYEAPRIESVSSYGFAKRCNGGHTHNSKIIFIRTTANLGFGGGNNIGLRHALSAGDADYVWLLNNDTIVRPQALSAMVDRMKAVPEAGMCGSTILYHDDHQIIQSLGGARYLKWAGVGVQLGANESWPINVRAESIEKEMSYVSGASMLISKQFLETVGLMEESYFLYFEEIDWAKRAAGRFKLAYAPNSIVYHKEGGTIGSSQSGRTRSPKSFYWLTRSRLRFTSKYYPETIPSVLLYSLINCTQWAFFNRNPRIFMAGVQACAHAGLNIVRKRLTR
jgi:GT2 family glycosyltransferase